MDDPIAPVTQALGDALGVKLEGGNNTVKVIKPEPIVLPTFPNNGHQMTAWQTQLGNALVTAGGHSDMQEIQWLAKCWAPDASFESLSLSELVPGSDRYGAMDIKLGNALVKQVGKIGSKIGHLVDKITFGTAEPR